MINIRWALLCNDVENNSEDGSCNFLGVTEELIAPAVPFSIGQLVIALGLQFYGFGIRQLSLFWRLAETGEVIYQSAPKTHHIHTQGGTPSSSIYPVFIHSITFPKFGKYYLEILIDGRAAYLNSFNLREGK